MKRTWVTLLKNSETSDQIDELSDIPMFVAEEAHDLYVITCNRAGFLIINEYLESYASDCSEKDLLNPYAQ